MINAVQDAIARAVQAQAQAEPAPVPTTPTTPTTPTMPTVPTPTPAPVPTLTPAPEPATVTPTGVPSPIKGWDEKAVLVTVKRRMFNPNKRDEEETENYGAGNVSKHLFKSPHNRVRETIAKFSAVYTYLKANTVPWKTGVDLLNIKHYTTFAQELRALIDTANDAADDLAAHWDYEVAQDLAHLSTIKPHLANPRDYPAASEVRGLFGFEVIYEPVPTVGDFRVEISDEDKQSLKDYMERAKADAAGHVISQMVEPVRKAIDKLSIPIGEKGAIFRNSLLDNLGEVAKRMKAVNVSDDPALNSRIAELGALAADYKANQDSLRDVQSQRDKAVGRLEALESDLNATPTGAVA